MEEDIQKKTYEEVAALKDLFLRRLMDDKIKAAAIVRLNENNEALQRQLDERAITSLVKEILLICDRIDAQDTLDDLTCSVEEELLEVLARRDFYKMPPAEISYAKYLRRYHGMAQRAVGRGYHGKPRRAFYQCE